MKRPFIVFFALFVVLSCAALIARVFLAGPSRGAVVVEVFVPLVAIAIATGLALAWTGASVRAAEETLRRKYPSSLVFSTMYTLAVAFALPAAPGVRVMESLRPYRKYLRVVVTDGRAIFFSGISHPRLRFSLDLRECTAIEMGTGPVSDIRSRPAIDLQFLSATGSTVHVPLVVVAVRRFNLQGFAGETGVEKVRRRITAALDTT